MLSVSYTHLDVYKRQIKDGNDYILSGSKTWISCGTIATHALIFATVDPALGHKGITCFVVDTKSKGFTAQAMHGKLGLRASDTASLFLDAVSYTHLTTAATLPEFFIGC